METMNRVDNISERDRLWELYLHTLAGYLGNEGTNRFTPVEIGDMALSAAKSALRVWEDQA